MKIIVKLKEYVIFIFLHCLYLSLCFEDHTSLKKRIAFYQKISHFSNNTISPGYSSDTGIGCIANTYLRELETVLIVPKSLSICPYYIFPFKFEIQQYIQEIKGMNETTRSDQKLAVYILTYYILYFKFGEKEYIKNYIKNNNLSDYFNISEPDESIEHSFPKILLSTTNYDEEHYKSLAKMGYPVSIGEELQIVYNWVSSKLIFHSGHLEAVYHWAIDFKRFKWAYSIIMSRGMTLRLPEWLVLEGISEKESTRNFILNKNIEKNKIFSKNVGAPCIIAMVDLCNHYQPKYPDMREKEA
jgi:hypothetical protein